jgi:lysophospholipase L1-like esterase
MSLLDPPPSRALNRILRRPQIIATRGRFPFNTASGATYTRSESALTVYTGAKACSNVQVVYTNRQASTAGEIDDLHGAGTQVAYTLESMVYQNARLSRVTFDGVKSPVVEIGAGTVVSDQMGFRLAAGSQVIVRSGAIFNAGSPVVGNLPALTGAQKALSAAAGSQVYSAGAFVTPGGGVSNHYGFGPVCLLGIPEQRHVAAMLWGDSIMWGNSDGNGDATYGHYGWAERGLVGVNGYNVPFVNCSRSGDSTPGYTSYQSWGRVALLEYVTHVVFGMGTNDIGGGTALATIQANCQAIWAEAKLRGVKAYHATITPKTTSTDSWATAANQSVVANYESGGVRGQFNAWLLTQVAAGKLDGVIDVNAAVEDPANLGKWITTGAANYATADGLHPSTAAHVLMGAAFNAVVASWSV